MLDKTTTSRAPCGANVTHSEPAEPSAAHICRVRRTVALILGRARRCSGCRCLVKRSHDDNLCNWPCSPFGFGGFLGGLVQSRRRWLVKEERKKIGDAWRKAEEMENGSLFFDVE